MKAHTLVLTGLTVLLIFASAACGTGAPLPEEAAAAPAEPTPEDVIESFLQWYAGYPGNALADGALASNPVVSRMLVEKVDAIRASFENSPGGYDPILCAQNRPQSFRVEILDRSPDSASAAVHTEFQGHRIYVGVMKIDGRWMIADVTCPMDPSRSLPEDEEVVEIETPTMEPLGQEPGDEERDDEDGDDDASESDPTAAWPVFRDDAYGFQIAYPPEWGSIDLSLRDPGAGGPPTTIRRLVIFYPQAWEERLRPGGEPDPSVDSYPAFSVQVSVGPLEAYRREFMELEASETMEVNGLSVLHEWNTRDDYNIVQYVFQHPENTELRITLTDPISGFSERAGENLEIVSVIPTVVSTFRFTDE